jgi:hypothetical protein
MPPGPKGGKPNGRDAATADGAPSICVMAAVAAASAAAAASFSMSDSAWHPHRRTASVTRRPTTSLSPCCVIPALPSTISNLLTADE